MTIRFRMNRRMFFRWRFYRFRGRPGDMMYRFWGRRRLPLGMRYRCGLPVRRRGMGIGAAAGRCGSGTRRNDRSQFDSDSRCRFRMIQTGKSGQQRDVNGHRYSNQYNQQPVYPMLFIQRRFHLPAVLPRSFFRGQKQVFCTGRPNNIHYIDRFLKHDRPVGLDHHHLLRIFVDQLLQVTQ